MSAEINYGIEGSENFSVTKKPAFISSLQLRQDFVELITPNNATVKLTAMHHQNSRTTGARRR